MNKKITFYNVNLHHVPPGDTKVRFDFLVGVDNFPFSRPIELLQSSLDCFRSFCENFNSDGMLKANITVEVLDE